MVGVWPHVRFGADTIALVDVEMHPARLLRACALAFQPCCLSTLHALAVVVPGQGLALLLGVMDPDLAYGSRLASSIIRRS